MKGLAAVCFVILLLMLPFLLGWRVMSRIWPDIKKRSAGHLQEENQIDSSLLGHFHGRVLVTPYHWFTVYGTIHIQYEK